jgi:Inorganic pyrophosphatase/exopolyphosphatase
MKEQIYVAGHKNPDTDSICSAIDSTGRIHGFVSRYHLISQYRKKKSVFLTITQKTQTVDGIEQADIIEVIDHHRLGDIKNFSLESYKIGIGQVNTMDFEL